MRFITGVLAVFLAVNLIQVTAGNACDVTEAPWGNVVDQGPDSIEAKKNKLVFLSEKLQWFSLKVLFIEKTNTSRR